MESNIWKEHEQLSEQELEHIRAMRQDSDVESIDFVIDDETIKNSALCISDLYKTFDGVYAVNHVSYVVPKGSFYGLVGPNGAGKTTTIAMVAGLLTPDGGKIYIEGKDATEDYEEVRNLLGVMPDGMRLFDRLTGYELLMYNALLRGIDKEKAKERATDLLNMLGLEKDANKIVSDYSAGMTKKITLGCAIIHAPKLLILDEPFEAVDPVSAKKIQNLLIQYVKNGGTVIFSSHVMDTVEKLCTHVAIMNKGKIVVAGSVEEVANGDTLENRFIEIAGLDTAVEEFQWLQH